jgi:hypothetical protein
VNGKQFMIGVNSLASMGKNRQTGKQRQTPFFPIYYDLGIDDVGSNVDYLVSQEWWKKNKSKIKAGELEFEGTRQDLIEHIEQNNLEVEVQKLVEKCWLNIEDKLKLKTRKKRFG